MSYHTYLQDTCLSWVRCRAASQASAREEQLQSENAALKGEVAYLNKLLAIACSEPSSMSCSPARGAGAGEVGGASLLERTAAVPPRQAGGAAGLSAERLTMLHMRNAQMDRQIVLAQGQIQVTSKTRAAILSPVHFTYTWHRQGYSAAMSTAEAVLSCAIAITKLTAASGHSATHYSTSAAVCLTQLFDTDLLAEQHLPVLQTPQALALLTVALAACT